MCFINKEKDRKKQHAIDLDPSEFDIIEVDVNLKLRGSYKTKTGLPKGLVVHFTAGHSDKGAENARRSLKGLAKRKLGCMTMDIHGNIFKAKNQGWSDVAYHAGKSKWMGKSAISKYCMGMEICNPGKLISYGGHYYPWWSFNDNKELRTSAKPINISEIHCFNSMGNIEKGCYKRYTEEQKDSLKKFIEWQLEVNPEFMIDWVVGHDEISPGRKNDPGGALEMTMPEFRKNLRSMEV